MAYHIFCIGYVLGTGYRTYDPTERAKITWEGISNWRFLRLAIAMIPSMRRI